MSADCIILLNSAAIFLPHAVPPVWLDGALRGRRTGVFGFFIVSAPVPSSFFFQLAMVGEFLFHLFQLLAYRFALLLFHRFVGVLLKGGGHNIHVLGLEKDQIFALSLLFYFFQTIINAILPGHPVERLDIIVRNHDVRDLCAALLQALNALPTCFLTLPFFLLSLAAFSYPSLPAALSGLLSKSVQ